MPITRFAGPLAAAWPATGPGATAGLLAAVADCLPVPPAGDRDTWAAARVDEPTLRDLRERAGRELGTPWPVPLARAYARYFRDGDRDGYEQVIFARDQRLSRAAVLAAATLDPAWIDEVADGVIQLCEQSSWCWPAHDDTFRRHGSVLPTVTDPYLDLGAGEVAGQLAWLDQLLGDQFDERVPGLRARIRHEVDRRVLVPFTARRDWHWLGLDGDVHNWNPWIHGNVLVAALRLVDDAERRAGLVDLVIDGLDRYAASLPADGAIDEGYAYWWNGACRLLEALDLLAYASRGALGGIPPGALRETVAFPHRAHLGDAWYLNLADGQARPALHQPWDALHRAARAVGDRAAEAHAAAHRRPGAPVAHESHGLGRLLRALTDPAWTAAVAGSSPLPRDVWFASTQVLLARPAAGSPAGLTLAAKGGHNGEHHNHNDVGSVVVAVGGVPVLVDAGRPTYTAQTFGPDRYGIWTMQSSWHNVPEILDRAQEPGRGYAARDVSVAVGDAGSQLTLDLAPAYPDRRIRSWRRIARLDRATGRITITDSWDLDPATTPPNPPATEPDPPATEPDPPATEPDPPATEPDLAFRGPDPAGRPAATRIHLLFAGQVKVGAGFAEIVARHGAGTVLVTWEPAGVPATTTVRELDDPMLGDVWGDRLTRLELDVTALGPAGTLQLNLEEQR